MKKSQFDGFAIKKIFIIFFFFLCLGNNCFSQPYPPIPANDAYFYQSGVYPNNNVPDWGGDDWAPNGIAHTDNYWIICSVSRDIWGFTDNINYGIWKIPVSYDLVNQSNSPGVIKFNLQGSNLDSVLKKYGHAGDIDVCTSPDNQRFLVVPLTSAYPTPYGGNPIIAFFNASNMEFVNYAYIKQSPTDTEQTDIGWCAVSPTDGRLYTSKDEASNIKRYKIQWDTIINHPDNHHGLIRTNNAMDLLDELGYPLTLTDMQGGEFTEDGELLYLSSGVMDCNASDGLHVFRHENHNWKRVKRSGNPLSPPVTESCFQLPQDCSGSPWAVEPEGLTIWNLDNVQAHSTVSGSLHVLQDNHNHWTSSSAYMYHYKSKSAGSAIFESLAPDVAYTPSQIATLDLHKISTGDINADGKTDLILILSDDTNGLTIKTQRSNGDGTFNSYTDNPGDENTIFEYPTLTGDVNGDGKNDLVFTFPGPVSGGLTIRTKVSNGNGQYTSYEDYIGDGSFVFQFPVLTGDVNGDGRTDLIFTFPGPASGGLTIRTKISNGNGQYTSYEDYIGDGSFVFQYPVLTGDVNGDGRTDLIFTFPGPSSGGLTIRTKISNGNGQYTSFEDYIGDGSIVFQYPALTGDVNGDGRTDLIFIFPGPSSGGLTIRTKMSIGNGQFTSYEDYLGDGSAIFQYPTLTGDVDGDGKTDIIFAGQNWDGCGLNIRVKRSNGDGTWCERWQVMGDIPEVHMYPTLTGDINGGGKTDLIFTYFGIPHPGLVINTKISQFSSYTQCSPTKAYYRSRGSGNWNDLNIWESSVMADFSSEVKSPAPLAPDVSNARSVIIRNGHNVLVTESVSTPKTMVNMPGSLKVMTGVNFTVVQ